MKIYLSLYFFCLFLATSIYPGNPVPPSNSIVFNIFESTICTCMLHTYTWTCFKAPVAPLFNIVRANVYTQFRKKDLLFEKKRFSKKN